VPQANESASRTCGPVSEKSRLPESDSHTIAGVGHTYTEVPGARTVDEFLPACAPVAARSRRNILALMKLARMRV